MVLSREIIAQIKDILAKNPQGLNITDIVREVNINRNTAGKYLDKMLVSGQVEMRHFGMAKIYALAHRVPLSSVLSISSEFIMQLDSGLRIVFVNGTFAQLLDTPAGDLVGKNIEYSPLVTAFDDVYDSFLLRVKDGLAGIEWSGELRPEKRETIFSCRIAPTALDNGKKGVTVILEDITGQKQSEDALKESEERFRLAMDASNDGLWDCDITTDTGYFSPGYYRMLGYEPGEFPATSKSWISLIHPDDLGHTLAVNKDCIENRREYFEAESRLKAKDGSWKWILSRGRAVKRDANGRALRMIGTHVDLTERKRLEDITNRFGRILDHSLNEIYTFSADSLKFIDANFGARQNLGYTLEEIRTFTPLDIKPEFTPASFELLVAPLKNGNLTEQIITTVHKRKDGSLYPVEIHLQLSRNETPPVFIAIARDITKRKAAENALKESQEKYRVLIETSFDGIIVHQNGLIVFANSAAARILGATSVEKILNTPVLSFVHPDFRDRVISRMKEAIKNTVPVFQEKFLRVDGSVIDVDVVGMPFIWRGEPAIHVVFRDISERERAVEALKESEERFRSFVENANDIVYSLNSEGIFTYVSPKWTELLGYETGEVIGRSFEDFIHPDYVAAGRATLTKVITTRENHVGIEYPVRDKNGTWHWQITNASVICNNRDNTVEFFGIARDITEQKRTADALRESEAKYRMLAESTTDLIYVIGKDNRVEYVNKNTAKIFGKTPAELTGAHLSSLFPPERVERQVPALQQIFRMGVPHHSEGPLTIDGELQWFDHVLTPIPDGKGDIQAVFGVSRNITWRKQAEEALRASEEKFRRIFEDGPLGMTGLDSNGRFILVNRRFCDTLGYTQEELLEKSISDVTHPDDTGRAIQNIHDIYAEKITLAHDEKRYLKKDGTIIHASVTVTPLRDRNNRIVSTISIIENITERKHSETLLSESERKFHELADLLPQSVWECDVLGNLTFANSGSFDMYRYSRSDFEKGLTIWQMMNPADRQAVTTIIKDAISNSPERFPSSVEYSALRSDGSTFPIKMYLAPIILDGAIAGMRGIGIDMTAQKQTEQALRESEDKFRRVFQESSHSIAIVNKDYRFVMVNRKFCDMMGYTSEELLKRSFVDITHPDHLEHDLPEVEKIFAGKIPIYRTEKRYIKKDGSVIWGSLTVSPFRDMGGLIVSTIAVVEDITEQKQSGKDQELSEKTS